jgi:S-DNA-T family DNA segregation ATPase FtsK/SpoIIIE
MRARWETHDRGRRAIIGVDAAGPFGLDLRRDGPHGLVAGTTGAGKSELLQTLVASLAANYPPARLSFLLIDYKGGAAFRRCVEFPHVVGFVTDLDEHLVGRALTSLKAELRRREHVLAEHEVPELIALERARPDAAPASLVIVIDEFASLKREMPQFVAELIEIARIGRTLGVHLLLATQRPSGVIDDHIKGNTGYSFALRVASAPDSMDVIDESMAARIPRDIPGRAFCRIGTDLTELQTAYVGAPLPGAAVGSAVDVRPFALTAQVSGPPQHSQGDAERTELDAIVDSAIAAHRELGVPAPPSPWLPPLPTFVPLDSLTPAGPGSPAGAGFALGLIDEPARQRQRALVIDLERDGNLLVLGAGGSGKTSTLRSIACALVQRYSADELNLYALEFGTGGLTSLAALPHTGAVVRGDDEELVQRTIRFFRRVCDERRDLFSRHGAATLSEFQARDSETLVPRIVVLLDDYAGFATAYERYEFGGLIDVLHGIAADGRGLGVHLCITGARRGAVPSALANALPQRLILRLSSEDEYGAAGLDPRTFRGAQMNPGRAFLLSGLETQIGCLAPEPGGEAQSTAIHRLAERLGARTPRPARSIARMPVDIPPGDLPAGRGWKVVVGIGGDDIAPVEIDLSAAPALICGAYRSGRSSLLALVVESLHRQVPDLTSVLLAPRRSPLTGRSCWSESLIGVEACTAGLEQLERRARESTDAPLLIVIDDGDELRDGIGLQPLEELLRIGRDHPVRMVAAAERQSARSAFSGWIKELRKDAVGCLLTPDLERDGDLFNVTLPRRVAGGMPQGRGFVVSRGASVLVQYGRVDLEAATQQTASTPPTS